MTFSHDSIAQGTLIHYWNFNSFTGPVTLPAIASLPADFSLISSPVATWVYQPLPGTSPATYCDAYPTVSGNNDSVNIRMGAPEGNAFRARNPNDQMEILIYMPTTGYGNLQITYGCMTSSYTSGDSVNVFSYSVDSGATWITGGGGLSEWSDTGSLTFRRISLHVNDPAAYNSTKFVFRILLVGRNTGTSGNNRFDNVTLDGDVVNPVLNVNQVNNAANYKLYPNPVNNELSVNSNIDGSKNVVITNMVGQTVFSGTEEGLNFTLNTSILVSGVYCITIRENLTGNVSTSKFIKQ